MTYMIVLPSHTRAHMRVTCMLLIPYARTNSSPWGRLCTSLAPHMDGLSLPLPRGMQHCPRPAARGHAMVPRAGEVPPSVAGVSPEAGGAPPPVAGVSPEAGVPRHVLPWPPCVDVPLCVSHMPTWRSPRVSPKANAERGHMLALGKCHAKRGVN